jgi:hypothetical protein
MLGSTGCRTFLKESVNGERSPSRSLRTGSALFGRLLFLVNFRNGFVLFACWHPSRLSSLREVAIVLFKAIAPNTFLRELLLTITVSSSATRTDADLSSCEFLTVRATPFNASCRLASIVAGRGRRIHGHIRVGPNGRDLKLPLGNSDRTTESNLFGMSPFC